MRHDQSSLGDLITYQSTTEKIDISSVLKKSSNVISKHPEDKTNTGNVTPCNENASLPDISSILNDYFNISGGTTVESAQNNADVEIREFHLVSTKNTSLDITFVS